jgi:hypothetical protein
MVGLRGAGDTLTRRVELLCWSGCPSHGKARKALEEGLADLGYEPALVTYTWVEDDADAVQRQFVGSPTFLVDGADLFPPSTADRYGLSCRIYKLRDGRSSPLPNIDDLRAALSAALSARSNLRAEE